MFFRNLLPVLGIMSILYISARLLGFLNIYLERKNKFDFLQTVITIICIGFMFCSAPIGLVLLYIEKHQQKNDRS